MELTDIVILAIARRLQGMDNYKELPVDPFLVHILSNVKPNDMEQVRNLAGLLGPDVLARVFACDPNQEPTIVKTPKISPVVDKMPDLPESIRLTADQAREAGKVGRWLNDYMAWSGGTANQTPVLFHEGAGLFLAATAVGRRTYLATPWGKAIFGNLYIMIAALSTYYRKTTSLNLATTLARAAFPERLLPEPGSPENFMQLLSGKLPNDLDKLDPAEQLRLREESAIAAQRSIIRDELSGLFKSMGKDYMAGMKERIMQVYESPDLLQFSSNGKGTFKVRNTALSILGVTTPAELAIALSPTDWQNGNLARFALLTPEADYKERPRNTTYQEPTDLIRRLKRIHDRLPAAVIPTDAGDDPVSEEWSLVCHIWDQCDSYQEALRRMTAPGSSLDDRLRSNYGRFHDSALKIAMLIAVMDWADQESPEPRPIVEPAHWFRAVQITESWRASTHRLLHDVSDNGYSQTEAKILGFLGRAPEGGTKSELLRFTHLKSRDLDEALANLIDAGIAEETKQARNHGPAAKVYRLL